MRGANIASIVRSRNTLSRDRRVRQGIGVVRVMVEVQYCNDYSVLDIDL